MHISVLSEFDAHFGDHCNHFRGKEEKENPKPAIEIILLKFLHGFRDSLLWNWDLKHSYVFCWNLLASFRIHVCSWIYCSFFFFFMSDMVECNSSWVYLHFLVIGFLPCFGCPCVISEKSGRPIRLTFAILGFSAWIHFHILSFYSS